MLISFYTISFFMAGLARFEYPKSTSSHFVLRAPRMPSAHYFCLLTILSNKKRTITHLRSYSPFFIGWAGQIRTSACMSQSHVPYRLATAQYFKIKWGGIWDSNPWSPVPQTGALTNYAKSTITNCIYYFNLF